MKKNYIILFLRHAALCLIIYNITTMSILHNNNLNVKKIFWGITPYDYKNITVYPNYLSRMSLLNEKNRNTILQFLNKNKHKNYLDLNYWKYKKIIESFDNDKSNFEKSFYKEYILSENNTKNKKNLKKYFIYNYLNFSHTTREKIIKSFKFKNLGN